MVMISIRLRLLKPRNLASAIGPRLPIPNPTTRLWVFHGAMPSLMQNGWESGCQQKRNGRKPRGVLKDSCGHGAMCSICQSKEQKFTPKFGTAKFRQPTPLPRSGVIRRGQVLMR
jgi:hypothetical protein